ncbi:SDR family oxidoreductase [Streptomyces sp. 372A]
MVFKYASSEDAAADVVRVVQSDGGKVRAVCLDLKKPDAPQRLTEAAEAHLGGMDILVNNAAMVFSPVPLAQTEVEVFDSVTAVNARSVFLTMRYAARQMRDGGRIVNMSTMHTVRPVPGIGPYAASKGAAEQLTAVAARELDHGASPSTQSPPARRTRMGCVAPIPQKRFRRSPA